MEEIQKWFEMKTRNVQEIIDGIPMSVWTIWKMDQEILCLLRFQDIKEKIAKDRKVIPDPIAAVEEILQENIGAREHKQRNDCAITKR